jgi:hypothetical protein
MSDNNTYIKNVNIETLRINKITKLKFVEERFSKKSVHNVTVIFLCMIVFASLNAFKFFNLKCLDKQEFCDVLKIEETPISFSVQEYIMH